MNVDEREAGSRKQEAARLGKFRANPAGQNNTTRRKAGRKEGREREREVAALATRLTLLRQARPCTKQS